MLALSNNNADGEVRGDAYVLLRRSNSISPSDFSPKSLPDCKAVSLDSRNVYCLALIEQETREVRADQLVKAAARQKEIEEGEAWLAQQQQISLSLESSYAAASGGYASSGTSWDSVAQCESGGDWSINTGNGYYGGLQFDSGTWDAYGNPTCAEASNCSMDEQIAAADRMPYDGWPNC